MAEVPRFINTNSTAGGDGTTNNTTGATRAYATIVEWESNEQTDLVADGDTHLVLVDGTAADGTGVDINGWTTGANNFVTIRANTASIPTQTAFDTGIYRLDGSTTTMLEIFEQFVRVERMQIKATAAWAILARASGTVDIRVNGCVLVGDSGGEGHGIGLQAASGSGGAKIWNNIIYDFDGSSSSNGMFISMSGTTSYVYNNTVVGIRDGIEEVNGTVVAKNNIVQTAVTNSYTGTFGSGTDKNCDDGDATAPGTTTFSGSVTFENAASDDFRLSASDTLVKGNGEDVSGDANLAFDDDFFGDTRTGDWDLGGHQVTAAAGGFEAAWARNSNQVIQAGGVI